MHNPAIQCRQETSRASLECKEPNEQNIESSEAK